jgi:ATP-dependent helicase HrpA
VILQMAALDLGDVEEFPFLDPPDRRQVRDGVALLHELGALDPAEEDPRKRLTPLGRRLAGLPVDPRLGRMVLEADRLGCADEVIVIAAALSIQDPRERPADRRQEADELHARFHDESDFLAHLALWRHVRELQRELSGNQFRKRLRGEYLHYLRVREWQDLVGQLRRAAKEAGVTINRTPAEPKQIHRALLSGLLSHIGLRDAARREYQGARNARFAIFPGSVLARRQPTWVMVAELVETSRLWGRVAARVDPKWIEPLAEHLVRRAYSEPRWDRERGAVVATERVTLYGLPIVAGRTIAYARFDPALARELFIRHALVQRDWDTRHAFLADNARVLDEVRALEDRVRRRDILVDDQVLFDFFDERIPEHVVSARHFDRWWKDEHRRAPDLLTYTHELLISPAAAAALDGGGRPRGWRQGDVTLPLSYRFEPGADNDGITVHVPLTALGGLRADGFDWLVPAFRLELVTALIRSLPKELRRALVPVPDVAAQVLARLEPRREPLLDALARELGALRGVRIPRDAWDPSRLEPHLRMTFRIEDDQGRALAEGNDLDAVRAQVRPLLREQLAAATPGLERTGLRGWELDSLPRTVELPGAGELARAYPALVDEGDAVGVRTFEAPQAQRQAMRAGTRRLLLLNIPSPQRAVRDRLGTTAQLALATAPHGSLAAVLDDATATAIDALVDAAGGPAWDAAGFARLRDQVARGLVDTTGQVVDAAVQILGAARDVQRRLDEMTAEPLQETRADVQRQLNELLPAGFLAHAGAARLGDLLRYVRAAARRLERLPNAPAVDRDRMRAVQELEQAYRDRLRAWPRGRELPESARELPWLLQELRVSQFAQGLGTRGQVSSKRIRRMLDELSLR